MFKNTFHKPLETTEKGEPECFILQESSRNLTVVVLFLIFTKEEGKVIPGLY
jgi:hypothetical protein